MDNELIKKKMIIGMTSRKVWEQKLSSVLEELVRLIKFQLTEEELDFITKLSGIFTNLIYAGILDLIRIEFDGACVEIEIVRYPEEGEEDDLDLSILSVVEWEIQYLHIWLMTSDLEYAVEIIGQKLDQSPSERIQVEMVQTPDENLEIPEEDEINNIDETKNQDEKIEEE